MRTSPSEQPHPRKLGFARENGAVDTIIDQLIELAGGVHYPENVREMLLTALKAGQENPQRADLKLMTSSLKEMRFTAKVFAPYRDVRKVTIFGSARTKPDDSLYRLARALGEKLARAGYMVITGGGQGIMQAANEGAGSEHSFGVNIRLPFENQPNHILEGSPRSITYKYFFNRKVAFIKEADAVALFPGGFGTQDEANEVLTLVQTGKRYPIPLILVDEPGGTYWSHWRRYIEEELAARSYVGKNDLSLFDTVQSADDAVEIVDRFYKRYHSLRFVGERLVIRINSPIDGEKVGELKEQYADILVNGGDLLASEALPEEADEPNIRHLHRLVLDFNRKDYARLRQLIDGINAA